MERLVSSTPTDSTQPAAGPAAGVQSGGAEQRAGDSALIELLRPADGLDDGLGVGQIAARLGVTATAVRQRLDRLMTCGLVSRSLRPQAGGHRGRPSHVYSLTDKGRRTGGDNFRDLALVLWREIRDVEEPSVRRGLIRRIGTALAGLYRDDVSGNTPGERLEHVASLLRGRDISCRFDASDPAHGGLPVLTSFGCPFPELAEEDRGICAAERIMLQDLVGGPVQLAACRLDGGACCRFTAADRFDDVPAAVPAAGP
jgi:DeoR family suf operon transcriptional repressor